MDFFFSRTELLYVPFYYDVLLSSFASVLLVQQCCCCCFLLRKAVPLRMIPVVSFVSISVIQRQAERK